jgi:hypothetical protein
MPAGAFVTPIAGASITTVWKPAPGVVPGSVQADGQAPFALGTTGMITPKTAAPANNRTLAKFCRIGTAVAIGGTAGVGTDGVSAGAGVFTNDTGVALAVGDYVWLTAGVTPVLMADEEIAPETAAERKIREDREAKETPAERKAREDREAKETPEERKARVTAELLALRKEQAQQLPATPPRAAKAGETEDERKLREAEEAEYQKAERERERNHKKAHA